MTDEPHLLRAVLDEPGDDFPRLVYADWCDEHGQPERAEYIRVQVELAQPVRCVLRGLEGVDCEVHSRQLKDYRLQLTCPPCRHRAALSRRNLESCPLALWRVWCAPLVDFGTDFEWTMRRGFVHALTCTAAFWLDHAAAILARQPVQEVRLTTWPEVEIEIDAVSEFRGRCRLPDDILWYSIMAHRTPAEAVRIVLKERWPRIAFTLPRTEEPNAPDPEMNYSGLFSSLNAFQRSWNAAVSASRSPPR